MSMKGRSIEALQQEHLVWVQHNFPDALNDSSQGLLGLVEEVGELAHAQLKGIQGIRHTPEEIAEMKIDAVADIFIYLMSYCNSEGIDAASAINSTWDKVAKRDWVANPMDADAAAELETSEDLDAELNEDVAGEEQARAGL